MDHKKRLLIERMVKETYGVQRPSFDGNVEDSTGMDRAFYQSGSDIYGDTEKISGIRMRINASWCSMISNSNQCDWCTMLGSLFSSFNATWICVSTHSQILSSIAEPAQPPRFEVMPKDHRISMTWSSSYSQESDGGHMTWRAFIAYGHQKNIVHNATNCWCDTRSELILASFDNAAWLLLLHTPKDI